MPGNPYYGIPTTATCLSAGQSQITASTEDLIYFDDGMDCYPFWIPFYGQCDGRVIDVPKIHSVEVEYIDRTPTGEVPECGRFKLIIKFCVTCPPPRTYTVEVTGRISTFADFLGDDSVLESDDGEVCTYRLTAEYRAHNFIDGTTGDISYTITVTDPAGRAGPATFRSEPGKNSIEVRNTIPGTGPCP